MPENLIEGLLSEMNRVREIIIEYEDPSLKGAGMIAASMMKGAIKNAENSIKENDVIKMMVCYTRLQEFEL